MIAMMLGISPSAVLRQMYDAVTELVNGTHAHKQEVRTKRYLEFSRTLEISVELADSANAADGRVSDLRFFPSNGFDHGFIWAAELYGGFGEYLDWYDTDHWGSDALFGLITDMGTEDVRLRKWLDDPSNFLSDRGNVVIQDAIDFQ